MQKWVKLTKMIKFIRMTELKIGWINVNDVLISILKTKIQNYYYDKLFQDFMILYLVII